MQKALKAPAFHATLRKQLRRASILNGKLVERRIRELIRRGGFEKNANLTVALKGSSKPLVDSGQVFQFITSKVIDDTTVFVGALRTDDHYNIIETIHNGATIPVTPAMRGLFFVLWQAGKGAMPLSKLEGRAAELFRRMPGDGWRPLRDSTTHIIIPPRPFIHKAMEDAMLQLKVKENWVMAVQSAMKIRAKE
jgi:hypothetical protein